MKITKVEKAGFNRKTLVRLALPFALLLTLLALIVPMAVPVAAADAGALIARAGANVDASSGKVTFTYAVSGTTTTVLTSSSNPSIYGSPVTFTATVTRIGGSGTPSGNVTFKDGANTLETVNLTGSGTSSRTAAFTTSVLSVGSHSITAVYNGDSKFRSSTSSPLTQIVNQKTITVTPTSGLITTEDGGTAAFTIVLSSKPAADVTIGLTSSDTTEGTVSPSSVTFTAYSTASSSQVRRPNGDGHNTGSWSSTPSSSSRYVCVDEDPYNDNDYITGKSNGGASQLFTFPKFNVPADASNIRLTVKFRARDDSSGNNNIGAIIRVNDNNDYYSDSVNPGNSFAQYSYTWDNNPRGGAWTVNEINGVSGDELKHFGVYSTDLDPDVRVSAVWAEVTYDVPAPGNWNTPQTVTITGVDDDLFDGDIAYSIITAAAVSSDPAYNGVDAADVSVTNINNDTIIPATVDLSNLQQTYDGGPKSVTVITDPSGLPVSVTYNGSETAPTDAGSYAVVAEITDPNYTGSASGTLVINKADATINVSGYTGTYDGDAHGANGTATGVNGEDLSSLLTINGTFTNVPGGTATWTFAGNENYNAGEGTVGIVINKADASITVTGYNITFDGNAHTATGSAVGVKGESLDGLDLSATTHTAAGTYNDNWTFTDVTGNYNNKTGSVTDTIGLADSIINIVAGNAVYDGQPHGCTATVTGVNLEESLTVYYEGRNGTVYAKTTSAPIDVGDYTASASYPGDANHSGSSYSEDFSITARGLTITAKDASKTYGETITFDGSEFTADGLVEGESIDSVTLTSGGAAASAQVGTYAIKVEGVFPDQGTNLANYAITYENGTLTVGKKALTITAHDAVKTYGEELTFTSDDYSVEGLIGTDSVIWVTLSSAGAAADADPGSYPIVPSNAEGKGISNYAITYVNGTLTVNAYKLVITTPARTFTAEGVSDVITVQVQEFNGTKFVPVNVDAPFTVNLKSSTEGKFAYNGNGLPVITSVVILPATSSISFYYTDAAEGSPVVTVSAEGCTSYSQTQTVLPRALGPTQVVILNQTIPAFTEGGVSGMITVQVRDANGNPVNVKSPTVINLEDYTTNGNPATGDFAYNANGLPKIDSVVILPATNSISFYYTNSAAGVYTITASSVGFVGSDSRTVNVNEKPAPADKIKVLTSDSITVKKGKVSGMITVQLQKDGKAVNAKAFTTLTLTATGGKFAYNANGLPEITSVTILPGTSSNSFYYKAPTTAGEYTITIDGDEFDPVVIKVTVTN